MSRVSDENSSSPSQRPCITPRKSTARVPFTPLRTSDNTPVPVTPSPFTTPRRRKPPATPSPPTGDPHNSGNKENISKSWPRIGETVPIPVLNAAVKEIFGYEPRPWQLKIAIKVLEGHDSIAIAGTGAGKSLVFAILALASVLTGFEGVVIVISPLKSLQKDQVRRFNNQATVTLPQTGQKANLSAIAINEDNHEEKSFTDLEKGRYQLCYASPECLLRNMRFKKMFRVEAFRKRIVAIVVDEAHVIETWKDEFRKDYGELETLRIISGIEIPWLGLTATASTRTFEIIYHTLGMGNRPFYGIDMGADRPNLAQWVRPMAYSASSMSDLLAFVPKSVKQPSDLTKTIFYLKTRQQVRYACDLCRSAVAPEFRKCMMSFTAVGSEEYKDEVIKRLHDGKELRWLFATVAAGMGTDIPDIEISVIFRVDNLGDTFQKGRCQKSACM